MESQRKNIGTEEVKESIIGRGMRSGIVPHLSRLRSSAMVPSWDLHDLSVSTSTNQTKSSYVRMSSPQKLSYSCATPGFSIEFWPIARNSKARHSSQLHHLDHSTCFKRGRDCLFRTSAARVPSSNQLAHDNSPESGKFEYRIIKHQNMKNAAFARYRRVAFRVNSRQGFCCSWP